MVLTIGCNKRIPGWIKHWDVTFQLCIYEKRLVFFQEAFYPASGPSHPYPDPNSIPTMICCPSQIVNRVCSEICFEQASLKVGLLVQHHGDISSIDIALRNIMSGRVLQLLLRYVCRYSSSRLLGARRSLFEETGWFKRVEVEWYIGLGSSHR